MLFNTGHDSLRIMVMAIGGGASSAINRMVTIDHNKAVSIAVDTDKVDLEHSIATHRLQLVVDKAKGKDAFGSPDALKKAIKESRGDILTLLGGVDVLLIVACMGGNTGTGTAPLIGQIAREQGIRTIGVVASSFLLEGKSRKHRADEGAARFSENVDALVSIPTERLIGLVDKGTPIQDVFRFIDELLVEYVHGIVALLTVLPE
ncbi:MAG: hypothetical protein FWH55_13925 [Oscillospiraceae bacterium]|nr:hypothetical protein [Oscillospiraceae bacterium]